MITDDLRGFTQSRAPAMWSSSRQQSGINDIGVLQPELVLNREKDVYQQLLASGDERDMQTFFMLYEQQFQEEYDTRPASEDRPLLQLMKRIKKYIKHN